jgi:hypothetical protein
MKNRWTLYLPLICFVFGCLLPHQVHGEEIEIRIIVPKADVYLKPSSESLVVSTVPMGVILKATEKTDECYRVDLPPDENGFIRSGYVMANAVEIVSAGMEHEETVAEPLKKDKPAEKILTSPPVRVPRENRKSVIGFSLKLWGSGGYLFGNQFNDHIQSENTINGESSSLRVDSVHSLMKTASNLGLEFILNIGPRFGMGIGFGYFMAKEDSRSEMTSLFEPGEITSTYSPKITALPITLSFHYGVPLGEKVRLNVLAGAGFYNGKVYWGRNYEWDSPLFGTGIFSYDWTANSDSLGFHGGLELEWEIIPGVALVIGGTGQRAVFTDMTGDLTWAEVSSYYGVDESGTENNVTLWYVEEEFYGPWYPQLWLRGEEPTFWYVRNVEKARISMANISLVLGIKIFLKK